MADPLLGTAFQAERLALIQEIARNLVGEPVPAAARTNLSGPANVTAEPGVADTDDTLLADRLAEPRGRPLAVAAPLAGLRPPQAAFAQPDAFQRVLAQFATSEPIMTPMTESAPLPDALAATGGLPAEEAGSAEARAPAEPISPEIEPITPEADTEIALPAGLRREPVAATATTLGASISDTAPTSAEAAFSAREATEAVVERALVSLGLAEGAANPAVIRSELGGIIASFILNAHFQPGWPPLRPVQDPEAKAFVAQLAKDSKLSKDDVAMLTYLANFGLNRTQLARILKLVAAATNRSKLLQSIAQLVANIGTLLGAVHAEIEALAEELKEARAESSRRERLTLR